MLKIPAIVLLLLYSGLASAISNIESQRPGPPPEGWSGHAELTASGKSGNVEEDHYGAGAKLTWKQNRDTFFTIARKARGETQGIKTADESFLHGRWIHQQTQKTATEAFIQWQENEFNKLVSRRLLGGGGRFDVFSQPDEYSFILGIGAFKEWEKSDLGTFIEAETIWRVNSYWAYKHQLNEQVNLTNTVYLQPSLEDFDDYQVLFELGLTVRLTNALHLRMDYHFLHDSQPPRNLAANPPIDAHETNTQYSTSFVYEF